MKTPNEIFNEGLLDGVLNLSSKFLFFWKNLWVINTKHGLDRIIQRNKLSQEQLKVLFKLAIEKVKGMSVKAGQEFLFYSRSLRQGFIAAIGPQGNIRLITFLPQGKSFPKGGTQKLVLESKEYNIEVVFLD